MPSESDLRDLLHGADPEGRAAIDLDAVLARARRRRRPKVIAAQALGSVALVGVLGTAIVATLPRAGDSASMIAQDSAAGGEEATAPFVDQDDALKASDCGQAPVIPPLLGWSVDLAPAPAAPGEAGVSVTLGRDGPVPEAGTATITSITLVDDGVVVGHAFPVAAAVPLGPGNGEPTAWEAVTWEAVAPTVSCDDSASALAAGTYRMFVRIVYEADGSTLPGEPITSALTELEIG